ncbi:hypothetical protein [Brucella anthropi]|uniref:hypothetical protein n=1 Tax=Brucella anthropi TaxID=529 RepID=UPI003D98313A
MSLTRIAIEYDSDAGTATVRIDNGSQQWGGAKLTFAQGITETRDGYLIRRDRDGSASIMLTGVPT